MRYAGVDEVGYGALAGVLTACCVVVNADVPFERLKRWWPVEGVRDSKKTTAPQRAALLPKIVAFIIENGGSAGISDIPPSTIDRYGYSAALEWAKVTAVQQVVEEGLPDLLVVDGNIGLPPREVFHIEQRVAPKADNDYWVVAAASIIAKVHRDTQMLEIAKEFPQYGFASNMGYAGGGVDSSVHVAALRKYGLSPHHRTKACATILAK